MKNLIVCYSLEGNTECAAGAIVSALGADVLRLETVKAYPAGGFRKFFWGGKSAVMAEKAFGKLKVSLGNAAMDAELALIDPKDKSSEDNRANIKAFCDALLLGERGA